MYKIIFALLLIGQISVNGQSSYNDDIKKAATSLIQTFDQLNSTTFI